MNILFVTPDFYPNNTGFANASLNLITSINKYGSDKYRTFVYTYAQLQGKEELTLNGTIYRYKKSYHSRLTRIFYEKAEYARLKEIITNNQIDVIFFETNTFLYQQYWALKDFGKKVFVRIHSTADTEVIVFGERKTIGSTLAYNLIKKYMLGVHNIVSTSNYYLDFVKKYYLDNNVYHIWNNKSFSLLYNTSIEASKIEGSCTTNNTFLTMGKLSANGLTQKGIPDLLKAIYYMKKTGSMKPDFHLIVVGDGDMYPYIQQLVQKLDLGAEVELIKKASHDEVLRMISTVKAIVLLSRYEGQSMFITESLSLGKPLILSDNNGMSDMIVNGENGYSVKTGDHVAGARAIIEIQNMDAEKIALMGKKSRDLYETNYSCEAVYKQFDSIMQFKD